MIPEQVRSWLFENNFGDISTSRRVSGGCINNGMVLHTTSEASFFLKVNNSTPEDMFIREAEGLRALDVPDGPKIPKVYLEGKNFLLLDDLAPAQKSADYWVKFGRQLAALHSHHATRFGFEHDNYIGSTHQPNPWTEDGYQFFRESRLGFQAKLAHQKGLLNQSELNQVTSLAERLPEFVPEQRPSLIHGDLWGGNALTDALGKPALIDPAAHFGWAEAELGMTALFGGFPAEFYKAYQEVRPLPDGLQERFPIYNLYHVLNHLNLFGGGYYSQVKSILRRYA